MYNNYQKRRESFPQKVLAALSDYSVFTVLVMVVTALSIFFFSKTRSVSLGDSMPQHAEQTFPGKREIHQAAPNAARASQSSMSSLDFISQRNWEPAADNRQEENPAPQVAKPASVTTSISESLPVPVDRRLPSGKLIAGTLAGKNSQLVPTAGFVSLREQEKGETQPAGKASSKGSVGSGATDSSQGSTAQKVRRMIPIFRGAHQGSSQSLVALKQQAYQLEQIGRQLLETTMALTTSAIQISPNAHSYSEGLGPHSGKR